MKHRLLAGSLFVVVVLAGCSDRQPASPEAGAPSLQRHATQEQGDPAVLARMHEINAQLAVRGSNLFLNEVTAITIGQGRPANRLLQQQLRWVPNDPRRNAAGDNITYLVDLSDGATTSGLTAAQTDAAIDAALNTWNTTVSCSKVNIAENPDGGADPDIFDSFFGFGAFGNPFLADITEAGWLPGAFFDAVFGPGGADGVLAFSVSFIFVGGGGVPTDINNDQYFDTALNEVYYNDNFGSPGPRAANPWSINAPLPAIDVQTVGLHENGHSLSSGHFGPPPTAVMNPVYAGIRQALLPIDKTAHCAFYASWPNP